MGSDLDNFEREPQVELGGNEFLGCGKGLHGDIYVRVSVADGKPTAIGIVSQNETPDITEMVWSELPNSIVAAGGTDGVDTVAGATIASRGLFDAVNDAIAQAQE